MIGKTGKFPKGKLQDDDEGGLKVAITADVKNKVIKIIFGTSLTWVALGKDDVENFIKVLQKKVKELE